MSSQALKPLEEKVLRGVEKLEDKSLSSSESPQKIPSDLGFLSTAAELYGESPIAATPLVVVDGLDLFGLADLWRESREALTGSRQMWEEKHHQSDLLNINTRANFSREPHGVLAHGGYKLPEGIEEDSQEDRDLMWSLMVTREGGSAGHDEGLPERAGADAGREPSRLRPEGREQAVDDREINDVAILTERCDVKTEAFTGLPLVRNEVFRTERRQGRLNARTLRISRWSLRTAERLRGRTYRVARCVALARAYRLIAMHSFAFPSLHLTWSYMAVPLCRCA